MAHHKKQSSLLTMLLHADRDASELSLSSNFDENERSTEMKRAPKPPSSRANLNVPPAWPFPRPSGSAVHIEDDEEDDEDDLRMLVCDDMIPVGSLRSANGSNAGLGGGPGGRGSVGGAGGRRRRTTIAQSVGRGKPDAASLADVTAASSRAAPLDPQVLVESTKVNLLFWVRTWRVLNVAIGTPRRNKAIWFLMMINFVAQLAAGYVAQSIFYYIGTGKGASDIGIGGCLKLGTCDVATYDGYLFEFAWVFVVMVVLACTFAVTGDVLGALLRQRLNAALHTKLFRGHLLYRLQLANQTDNFDARITDDSQAMLDGISSALFGNCADYLAYPVVYSLARLGFAFNNTLNPPDQPGVSFDASQTSLIVCIALGMCGVSMATYILPMNYISQLFFLGQKYEGEFRSQHAKAGLNSEQICFYHGEAVEGAHASRKYDQLYHLHRKYYAWQGGLMFLRLLCTTAQPSVGYLILTLIGTTEVPWTGAFLRQMGDALDFLLILPVIMARLAFAAGAAHRVGELMEGVEQMTDHMEAQARTQAEAQARTFASSAGPSSASSSSSAHRPPPPIDPDYIELIDVVASPPEPPPLYEARITYGGAACCRVRGIKVEPQAASSDDEGAAAAAAAAPHRGLQSALFHNISLRIERGQSLVIMGESGCGKSSLLRVIAGLWPVTSGAVVRPSRIGRQGMFFLPQKSYVFPGTLAQQISYPLAAYEQPEERDEEGMTVFEQDLSDEEMMYEQREKMRRYLDALDLAYLIDLYGWDESTDWNSVLSSSERQRLSFVRLYFHRPWFCLADESTSSLDLHTEQAAMTLCTELNITMISVAHRPTLIGHHKHILHFDKSARQWNLLEVDPEYRYDALDEGGEAVTNGAAGAGEGAVEGGSGSDRSTPTPTGPLTAIPSWNPPPRRETLEQRAAASMRASIKHLQRRETAASIAAANAAAAGLSVNSIDPAADEEEDETEGLNMHFIRRLFRTFALITPSVTSVGVGLPLLMSVCMGISAAVTIIQFRFLAADAILLNIVDNDTPVALDTDGAYLGVNVVTSVMQALSASAGALFGILIQRALVSNVHSNYFSTNVLYTLNHGTERLDGIDGRIVSDSNEMREALSWLFGTPFANFNYRFGLFPSLVALLVTLSYAFIMSWPLTLFFLGTLIAAILVQVFAAQVTSRSMNHRQQVEAHLRAHYSRLKSSIESVTFFEGMESEAEVASGLLGDVFGARMNYALLAGLTLLPTVVMNYWLSNGSTVMATAVQLWSPDPIDPEYIRNVLIFTGVMGKVGLRLVQSVGGLGALSAYTHRISDVRERAEMHQFLNRQVAARRQNDPDRVSLTHADIVAGRGATSHTLVSDLTLAVSRGESVLVMGPSACGKSSLHRLLASLWDIGLHQGARLSRPQHVGRDGLFFIPQTNYVTEGSLAEQIIYPHAFVEGEVEEADLVSVLGEVGLAYLVTRWGLHTAGIEWSEVLSGGEAQRLGVARMLYHRPTFACMDESTSALDLALESDCMAAVARRNITLLSIATRLTQKKYHRKLLYLDGFGGYTLTTIDPAAAGRDSIALSDYTPPMAVSFPKHSGLANSLTNSMLSRSFLDATLLEREADFTTRTAAVSSSSRPHSLVGSQSFIGGLSRSQSMSMRPRSRRDTAAALMLDEWMDQLDDPAINERVIRSRSRANTRHHASATPPVGTPKE